MWDYLDQVEMDCLPLKIISKTATNGSLSAAGFQM